MSLLFFNVNALLLIIKMSVGYFLVSTLLLCLEELIDESTVRACEGLKDKFLRLYAHQKSAGIFVFLTLVLSHLEIGLPVCCSGWSSNRMLETHSHSL